MHLHENAVRDELCLVAMTVAVFDFASYVFGLASVMSLVVPVATIGSVSVGQELAQVTNPSSLRTRFHASEVLLVGACRPDFDFATFPVGKSISSQTSNEVDLARSRQAARPAVFKNVLARIAQHHCCSSLQPRLPFLA